VRPLDLAKRLAVDAGTFLLRAQPGRRRIAYKGGVGNLVTEMDVASEKRIVAAIRRAFPRDRIVAEEGGGTERGGGSRWFVDPLDGTTNYAHGFPIWCVSIARETDGEMELGVVYSPALRELFVGQRGRGATRNGARLSVSGCAELSRALLCTGFPYRMRDKVRNLAYWDAFVRRAQAVRRVGSAALDLCWTAAGVYDGFWEMRLGPWDVAAGALIAREAGAVVTDWRGGPMDLFAGEVLAANAALHRAMKRVIAGVARRER
jgi:myo-inositol-1(or 4)-monophosphatase